MKHFTLKLLLLVAMAFTGGNAMADDWSIDFTGLVTENASITISTTETVDIGDVTLGTCSYDGKDIDSKFVLQTGTSWLMRSGGLYQFNGGARSFGLKDCIKDQVITITASGDPSVATNATLKSSGSGTYVYTVTADGGVRFNPARYLYFYTIKVEDPASNQVNYTVKYQDMSGNKLKDDKTYQGEPGTAVTVYDADKEPVYSSDGAKKYTYNSDNTAGLLINADGSTVVILKFNEVSKHNYSVTDNFGTVIEEGSLFADEQKNVYWSEYIPVESVWYYYTDSQFGVTVDVSNGDFSKTVDYSFFSDGFLYFEECEKMAKSRSAAASLEGVDYSGGYAPRHYSYSWWRTQLLPPGAYMITIPYWNNNSTDTSLQLLLGDDQGNMDENVIDEIIGEARTSGYIYTTFVIPPGESKALYIYNKNTWNSNVYMDYVLIEEMPSLIINVSSAGFATLCSEYSLDFSLVPEVKAYFITGLDADGVTLTTEQVEGTVEGMTGLLIEAEEGTYKIPFGEEVDMDADNNKLVGVIEQETKSAGIYVLLNDYNGVGFYRTLYDFTLTPYTAYLPADFAPSNVKELRLNPGGATGITQTMEQAPKDNIYYNLSGQRVAQPMRGIYIVNGKKVLVK